MNEFHRSNKSSGVHWLRGPIENIKIRIKIRPQDGLLSLPKFEEYTKDLQRIEQNVIEEYTLLWQQKVFSRWELQRYSDVHNCVTDVELNYCEMIKNSNYEPKKIFTYLHEDRYLPLPLGFKKKSLSATDLKLISYLGRLNLNERNGTHLGNSSSMRHLYRSEENIYIEEDQWIAFHVAYDNSQYNEDSDLLLKREAILMSLYYNTSNNCLIMYPDLNNLELNPYTMESLSGVRWSYQYSVDMNFGESSDELMVLLKKLFAKWENRQKQILTFIMPPLSRKQYYVSLEVLTATDFDADTLYVEFNIKVPEELKCNDPLHGRTHTSEVFRSNGVREWCFSHLIELSIEANAATDPPPIQIYLEAISKDWWGRHRTEGYTYLNLSLTPGRYKKQLSCSRPEELDTVLAENRRFFVGGCHLLRNLQVLSEPHHQDANFRFITTGSISLVWNTISQVSIPGIARSSSRSTTSSASALLLGAEAVLRQYRKARARLAAATKDLDPRGIGDG